MTNTKLLLLFLFVLPWNAFSQVEAIEVFQQPQYIQKSSSVQKALITLPFFDDFAYPYTTPLPSLWQDSDAYVNRAFAKNTVTIGVASLDAMDKNGQLHANVNTSAKPADYITSRPINLKTYEIIYASDRIYHKEGVNLVLLSDSYYLYNDEIETFIPATQGVTYKAGDTIYQKNGESYSAIQDSLYDYNKQYIIGSYNREHQIADYTLADSLALSFYFQAGGIVDEPEATDSLVLEFYAPYDTTGIFINEISAHGIELYNATDSIYSFEGSFLLFEPLESCLEKDSLRYYKIQESIAIAPFSFLVLSPVQFGVDSFTVAYAYLYNKDTVLIDSITLQEPLGNDITYARIPDGNPIWSYTASESLGDNNPAWIHMWSTSEKTGDTFMSAYIPIIEERYLVKGFKFRFMNYASLSNDVSHARNEDFWHLDMILLDAGRSAENKKVPDVAFASEITPLYTKYKAMPIAHFANVTYNDFRLSIPAIFTNFDSEYRKVKFHFSVKKNHADEKLDFSTYEADIPPYTTAEERDNLTDFDIDFFDFIANDVDIYDEASYEFQYYFTDNSNPLYSQYRWNDTCRSTLTLANYYAYDDGTPEAGYGLREAPMGKVAYRFDMLQKDTIKSIGMYFNPTLLGTATTFNLCIWTNNNGYPGELVYYSPSEKTQYADGLYEFTQYDIKPECITNGAENLILEKSFFIGWEQPNDVLLNIGIDLNASLSNRLFYNLGFEWENSVQTGALLIRPYFGNYTAQTDVHEIASTSTTFIYPSICTETIHISSNDAVLKTEIYTVTGIKILESTESDIQIAHLPNGYYEAIIYTERDTHSVHRFIIAK